MSALTVTLGADITALKRAMAGATELVGASARRMGKLTGAGLAGLGRGGAAALQKGFSAAGTAFKASIGAAMAGGAAAVGVGMKAVNAAADFEQTKVAFTTLIGDAAKVEQCLGSVLAESHFISAATGFDRGSSGGLESVRLLFGARALRFPFSVKRMRLLSVLAPRGH